MGSNPGQAANAIPVWIAPAPAGAAPSVRNITTDATTLVKTGAGTFNGLSINTVGDASTVKVYDGLTAAGTLLGTFSSAAIGNFQNLGWPFAVGLCIVTASSDPAADITVTYF